MLVLRKLFRPVIVDGIRRFVSSDVGFRPRRSLLYVPGDSAKKITKAATLNADSVMLDCEDGVALSQKVECRSVIRERLQSLNFPQEVGVRINSLDTEFALGDLQYILTSPKLPDAIMVPKIESVEQIKCMKSEVQKHLKISGRTTTKLSVIGQAETPKGMFDLRPILEEATQEHANLRFETFVFGSDDFLASIGAVRTLDATELLFARQYFIMHAKGFNLQAIDMVDINFKDLDSLRGHCEAGAKMGFTGKQVIHPSQINTVNTCFSPSAQAIEYAEQLIEAFNNPQLSGTGAFNFGGKMIDMPSVKQAQNIISLAKSMNS